MVNDLTQREKLVERHVHQIAVRLARADYVIIQKLVEAGLYRSSADFLREAVRDKLRNMEVVSVQNADLGNVERIIEEYLEKHPGPNFASEIADALGLDYSVVFKTVQKLLEERRIKRAKA